MDRQLPVWASVALVAVISALLLVSTHLVTGQFAPPEGVIGKDSPQGEALPAAEQFVPVELSAGSGLDNCYEGRAGGKLVGSTAQITVNGYGGPVEVVVGMDLNGLLTGISVGGEAFNESPGLGAKAKDAQFRDQFVGIAPPISLQKGDATSSATQSGDWATAAPAPDATSSATQSGDWATAAPAPDATSSATQSGDWATAAPAPDATSSATQSGDWATAAPAPDATSSATQSGDWATAAPATQETPAAVTVAPEATAQPAGTDSTVDAISGATITSTAVVDGVNKCASFLMTLIMSGQL